MRTPRPKRRRPPRAARLTPIFAAVLAAGWASTAIPAAAQILLLADEIVYDAQSGEVSASGNVEISEAGRVLRADVVTYHPDMNVIGASGHVSLTEPNGDVAFADTLELTGDLREGALQGFAALFGENGRLAAVSGRRWEGRYTEARSAVFTLCRICAESGDTTPVWQIKAARVVHDQAERELIFEDATLEFLGLPVAYVPLLTQADPTVRHKSGLLLPTIGSSTYLGTFVQAPYYISLGPSRDATIEPYLTGGAGQVLRAEYRSRFNDGGYWLQGSLGYDAAAPGAGESEWISHIFGSGRFPFAENWRAGFDLQLTSNDTYLRRYDISYLDRLATDVFVERLTGRNRTAVAGYFFQSLRESDAPGAMPLVLPFAEYTYIPQRMFYGGRLRLDSSALLLVRDEGTDIARGSAALDWMRQFITENGQLMSVDAMGRTDLYHVVNALSSIPGATGDTETIGRGVGYVAFEWRWPFIGNLGLGETSMVVEPIAQLVAASGGGNPAGLPNEDSTTFEFDETNLLTPNEFPGLDLWTGGPRSNIGVRTTAFFPFGSVEAMLGEEFRARRDPSFAPGSGVGDRRSDIVGRVKVDFPPYVSLVHRFRIDPTDSTLRRNEIYLTGSYGRSTLDFSYLKLPRETTDPTLGPREEINLTGSVVVTGNWALFAETRRDLQAGRWLDAGFGLLYEDECFMAQVGFRRRETSDRDLRPSSSVILKVGLKTGLTG